MELGDDRDPHDLEPNPEPIRCDEDDDDPPVKKRWHPEEETIPKKFMELTFSKLKKSFRHETGTGRWSLEVNISREKSKEVNMLTKWKKAFGYIMDIPGVELTIHPYSVNLPNITTTAGLPADEEMLCKYALE